MLIWGARKTSNAEVVTHLLLFKWSCSLDPKDHLEPEGMRVTYPRLVLTGQISLASSSS